MSAGNTVSEWMKIMLEEIARKNLEQEQMRAEEQRRRDEDSVARSGTTLCYDSPQCTDD